MMKYGVEIPSDIDQLLRLNLFYSCYFCGGHLDTILLPGISIAAFHEGYPLLDLFFPPFVPCYLIFVITGHYRSCFARTIRYTTSVLDFLNILLPAS